jgi:hypothetical protein
VSAVVYGQGGEMTGVEVRKILRAKFAEINARAQEFSLQNYKSEKTFAYDQQRLGALEMLRAIDCPKVRKTYK